MTGLARPFLGLRAKLVRTLLGGAAAILALAFVLTGLLAERPGTDDSQHALDRLAAAVEDSLAIGAHAHDQALLQVLVEGLGRQDSVGSVQVYAPNGDVLASLRPDLASNPAAERMELMLRSPSDPRESAGRVVVTAREAGVLAGTRHDGLRLAAVMTGEALLFIALLYWAVARVVSKPISALAQALRDITPGTRERLHLPDQRARDEICVLADGANALLDTVEQALDRERRLLAEIAQLETRYRRIFESSSAGIFVLDGDGGLVAGNPTLVRLTGIAPVAAEKANSIEFIEAAFADPRRVREMIRLSQQRGESTSGDLELLPQDGRRIWVHCLLSARSLGNDDMVEGVIYDVTVRKSAEYRALYHSQHDALTGLKNRAGIMGTLKRRVRSALRDHTPLTLLGMDLDGFKAVNDQHGHQAGDQVLIACAQRLRTVASVGGSIVVGRLGGDEFMVILEGLDVSNPFLSVVCHNLLDSLRTPITLDDGKVVRVGASIGAAGLFHHAQDTQELIEAADQAMYAVKSTGKNSHAVANNRIVLTLTSSRPLPDAPATAFGETLPMTPPDMAVKA